MTETPNIKIESFEGPLETLLHLIEDQKMDITQIALANVADQFLQQLHRQEKWDPDVLADFLVIAAKLVLIKSKILLPALQLTDEEEEGTQELERQLKLLKMYLDASKTVNELYEKNMVARTRDRIPAALLPQRYSPPPNVRDPGLLESIFIDIVEGLKYILPHPRSILQKAATLEQRINEIRTHVMERLQSSFRGLVGSAKTKMDVIVTFLALLELVKQRTITVEQGQLFEDIAINKHNDVEQTNT